MIGIKLDDILFTINGIWTFYIVIDHPMFNFRVFELPYWEYDPNPASEPYNIPIKIS